MLSTETHCIHRFESGLNEAPAGGWLLLEALSESPPGHIISLRDIHPCSPMPANRGRIHHKIPTFSVALQSCLSYCWAGFWLIYSITFSSSLFPSQTPESAWSFLHSSIRNSELPSRSSKMTFWLSWMNSNKQTSATNMTRMKWEQCHPSRLLLLSTKLRATELHVGEKYARHVKLHQLWIVTVPFALPQCKSYKFFIKKEELWASQYSSAALTLPSPTLTWYPPPLPPAEQSVGCRWQGQCGHTHFSFSFSWSIFQTASIVIPFVVTRVEKDVKISSSPPW